MFTIKLYHPQSRHLLRLRHYNPKNRRLLTCLHKLIRLPSQIMCQLQAILNLKTLRQNTDTMWLKQQPTVSKKTCGVEQNLNLYLIQELIKSPGFRNAVVEIFADHKRSVLRHNMAVTPADRVEKSSSNSRKIISQQRPVITSHLAHNKAKKHKASSQF